MNYQPIDLQMMHSWIESDSAGAVYQIIKALLNDRESAGDVMELSLFKLQTWKQNRQTYVHFRQFKSLVDLGVFKQASEGECRYDVFNFCLIWQFLDIEQQYGIIHSLKNYATDKAECQFFLFNPLHLKVSDIDSEYLWLNKSNSIDLEDLAQQLKKSGFEYIQYRSVYPKLTRFTNVYQKLLGLANEKTPGFEKLAGPIIQVSATKQRPKMIKLPNVSTTKISRPSSIMNLLKEKKN